MDKIMISSADVDALFAWRDKNIDLVLRCPCPLKAVELHFSPNSQAETGFYLRCVREKPNLLRLYIGPEGEKAGGYFLLERMPDGRWLKIKDTIGGDETSFKPSKKDFGDSLVAMYCTVMAVMVHSSDFELPDIEKKPSEKKVPAKKQKKAHKKHTSGTTYILRRSGKSISVSPRGSHASPKGIFTVRGHWRHYKNGNIVWVSEYRKGTGKKKPKTYKIGGQIE